MSRGSLRQDIQPIIRCNVYLREAISVCLLWCNSWTNFNLLKLTDVYYGGESVSIEQPQAFTCPFCGQMGFTEATLQEHVTSEHADSSTEVVRHYLILSDYRLIANQWQVCPVCAALPGGEPNHVTDDFATHLTLEHRSPRELISFSLNEWSTLENCFTLRFCSNFQIWPKEHNLCQFFHHSRFHLLLLD